MRRPWVESGHEHHALQPGPAGLRMAGRNAWMPVVPPYSASFEPPAAVHVPHKRSRSTRTSPEEEGCAGLECVWGRGKGPGKALRSGVDRRGRAVTSPLPSITALKNDKAHWAPFYFRPILNQKTLPPLLGRDSGEVLLTALSPGPTPSPATVCGWEAETAELAELESRPGTRCDSLSSGCPLELLRAMPCPGPIWLLP